MFSLQSFAQNDFRKMNWGDSATQLKTKYPDVNWETETDGKTRIYFTDDYVGGLKATIAYYFVENKFQIGAYIFIEKHSANNLYYEDFVSISTFLKKKYDMELNESWNNTSWKGDDDSIGYALAMGHVEIEEAYEDEQKAISHSISGDGFLISHTLRYASMDYVKSKRESSLDDF
ncbi:MAG: hypothetical protein ABJJ25_15380 [Eudoraea sp.]|uniref:hypothetical protein n=1 Tax=Eudoraea sp. TaxID=1979955 RepID=UPI0032667AD4